MQFFSTTCFYCPIFHDWVALWTSSFGFISIAYQLSPFPQRIKQITLLLRPRLTSEVAWIQILALHFSAFKKIAVMTVNEAKYKMLHYSFMQVVCICIKRYIELPPHPQDLTGICKTMNLLLTQNSCKSTGDLNYSKPIKIPLVVLRLRRKRE